MSKFKTIVDCNKGLIERYHDKRNTISAQLNNMIDNGCKIIKWEKIGDDVLVEYEEPEILEKYIVGNITLTTSKCDYLDKMHSLKDDIVHFIEGCKYKGYTSTIWYQTLNKVDDTITISIQFRYSISCSKSIRSVSRLRSIKDEVDDGIDKICKGYNTDGYNINYDIEIELEDKIDEQ